VVVSVQKTSRVRKGGLRQGEQASEEDYTPVGGGGKRMERGLDKGKQIGGSSERALPKIHKVLAHFAASWEETSRVTIREGKRCGKAKGGETLMPEREFLSRVGDRAGSYNAIGGAD